MKEIGEKEKLNFLIMIYLLSLKYIVKYKIKGQMCNMKK